MGYRSDWVLALPKTLYVEHFINNSLPSILTTVEKREIVTTVKECSFFLWEERYVKFYEEYPEVNELIKFVHSLQENETTEFDFGFIRLGEGPGDLEMYGEPSQFGIHYLQIIDHPYRD